jgi:hypothetical protein
LRQLDTLNPAILRPSRFASFSACAPLVSAILTIPLAYGAAPKVPFIENPIVLLLMVLAGISLLLIMIPRVFQWDWKASYYGFSPLCLASLSLLAIIPLAALTLYGRAPYGVKGFILLFYVVSHFLWGRKFVRIYEEVFNDEVLRSIVYQEEHDAVYYMKKGDEFLLRKYYRFSQMPPDRYIALFILVGLLLAFAMQAVTGFMGVPFTHVFLIVAMVPISCMCIGFAVRGFLVFYLYPAKLKKSTGKCVYVDVSGKHHPLKEGRQGNPNNA